MKANNRKLSHSTKWRWAMQWLCVRLKMSEEEKFPGLSLVVVWIKFSKQEQQKGQRHANTTASIPLVGLSNFHNTIEWILVIRLGWVRTWHGLNRKEERVASYPCCLSLILIRVWQHWLCSSSTLESMNLTLSIQTPSPAIVYSAQDNISHCCWASSNYLFTVVMVVMAFD